MKKPKKPFTVHFVCRGNTYRSRLAAAYMHTIADDRFVITSSGINAQVNPRHSIETYTKALAKAHKLEHGIAGAKTQTTSQLLADADVIVFMNKDVYEDALKDYAFDQRKALVWHIPDVAAAVKQRGLAAPADQELQESTENTFASIRRHCNQLREYLTHTAWIDVVDAQNNPTGLRLPMAWATDRGLWHRGVHVVVRTSDGKFVVGKRVKTIVFAPGMLEISLGGGIDTGETPLQAAARETHEELGVHVPEKHFRPLFMHRIHSFHPHYNKRTRGHVYVYSVTLPLHSQHLVPQPGEVAELRLLSKRQVRQVLLTHRMVHFGRLKWGYKLSQKAVAYSLHP